MKSLSKLASLFVAIACAVASAQTVERVSVSSSEAEANGASTLSFSRTISADGRFVVFASLATNLVANDTNGSSDVFVRDRAAGTTVRVSVNTSGGEAAGSSRAPAISDDGRFVVFESTAANLAVGDTNGAEDVFVHDRVTSRTTIVSVDSNGVIGSGASGTPSISGDGRFIAFASLSDLAGGAANGFVQVYVYDQSSLRTALVSAGLGGGGADEDCANPEISGNGRQVAFESAASNLVGSDGNGTGDVFVRDLVSGALERASVDGAGGEASFPSQRASISQDGRFVAFDSLASELAPGDPLSGLDVFLRDRLNGTTTRISADPSGVPGDAESRAAAIDGAAGWVAFASASTNLAPGAGTGSTNVYVRQVATGYVALASIGVLPPAPHVDLATAPSVSAGGKFVVFQTGASNLVLGDANGMLDVFVADLARAWHPDADSDGFGDASATLIAVAPPAGHVIDGTDCDDSNPSVHPGAPEFCNGIDDDCDTLVDESFTGEVYCTSAVTTNGCTPAISTSGLPSATATNGFDIYVSGAEGGQSGAIVFSLGSTAVPWAVGSTSTRCVRYPIEITGPGRTGGTPGLCDGAFTIDWNAYMASHPTAVGQPVAAGATFYAQGWLRDPGAITGINMSDAVAFSTCP